MQISDLRPQIEVPSVSICGYVSLYSSLCALYVLRVLRDCLFKNATGANRIANDRSTVTVIPSRLTSGIE